MTGVEAYDGQLVLARDIGLEPSTLLFVGTQLKEPAPAFDNHLAPEGYSTQITLIAQRPAAQWIMKAPNATGVVETQVGRARTVVWYPGGIIRINSAYNGLSADAKTFAAIHEMGHNLGFTHPEDGTHIHGTESGSSYGSVMVAELPRPAVLGRGVVF